MKPYTLNGGELSTISYSSGIDANGDVAVDNGFVPEDDQPHKWGASSNAGTPGGSVTFNYFNGWTTPQRIQVNAGLALWSDIANIQFVPVPDSTTNNFTAQLTFFDDTSPPSSNDGTYTIDEEQGAAKYGTPQMAGVVVSGVNLQSTVYGWQDVSSFTNADGYGITTMVHEEGHVLGLAHTGNYNATGDTYGSYAQRNAYDSQQWSIMSYISPSDTRSAYYNQSTVTGTDWKGGTPQTWMPLDILAAQRLYGTPTNTPLSGGQTFGFHCNVQGGSAVFFDFTRNATPIVTLWDAGFGNTLDLSGFATASAVDLRPGMFSSAAGLTNNIGIGFGVAIDTAIGGVLNDGFIVNDDSDHIVGGGGSDTVTFAAAGGIWNETGDGGTRFWGNAQVNDQLDGVQHVRFTGGADTISATGSSDDVTVTGGGNDVFLASGLARVLSGGANTIVVAAGNAAVQASGGPGDVVFGNVGSYLDDTGGAGTDTIVASVATLHAGSGGVVAFGRGTGSVLDLLSSVGASTVVGDPGGVVSVQGANGGVFVGGSGGNNFIDSGNGFGVDFAGGNNDTLFSSGAAGGYLIGATGSEYLLATKGGGLQQIYAGSGDDTLLGGTGSNLMVVGSGAATATGNAGSTLYEALNGHSGGSMTILDWNPAIDYLGLYGYGAGADQAALAGERPDGAGGTVITLADQTRITFVNVAGVGAANLI